jgi:excisionase family DNA binding protein
MSAWMTNANRAAHAETQDAAYGSNGMRLMPMLLTVRDAAELLRTTNRAVYALIERRQLPGVLRIGRRVLLRADHRLHWLDQKSAPSLRSEQR